MTKRKRAYLDYLESSHWKNLRREAFERDGWKCCRCGSPSRLQGHHKKYGKDLTKRTVKDIETLCENCHNQHHKNKAKERKERRKQRMREAGIRDDSPNKNLILTLLNHGY